MKHEPRKVFIIKDGKYIEITYAEHREFQKSEPAYNKKHFVLIQGYLMESTKKFRKQFYKDKRRQKYLKECAEEFGQINFEMLDTEEMQGMDILIDPNDMFDDVVRLTKIEKLEKAIMQLPKEQQILLDKYYREEITETELATLYGVSQ